MSYTIKQISTAIGYSNYTLRYYEKEGLLHPIKRDSSGNRCYEECDLECIFAIVCLKNTGMPIKEIRKFVVLTAKGEATLEERRQMVVRQKEVVEQKIQELQKDMERINNKLVYYDNICNLQK